MMFGFHYVFAVRDEIDCVSGVYRNADFRFGYAIKQS